MIEYLYKKNNTDFRAIQNVEQWLRLGFNFSVFDAYRINNIIYTENTQEFRDAINLYKTWHKLGAKF